MVSSCRLSIPFSLRGTAGKVVATVGVNTDPSSVGFSLMSGGAPTDYARGFPICEATVEYPRAGYSAVFGWTQLVSSTDTSGGAYEMDPIAIYADVDTPFAWYGVRPVLFDAPSRASRDEIVWRAHSFLCISADAVISKHVEALAGFEWGFDIDNGAVALAPVVALDHAVWDAHLPLLRASYRSWAFRAGFSGDRILPE